jgi:hypothetical protein
MDVLVHLKLFLLLMETSRRVPRYAAFLLFCAPLNFVVSIISHRFSMKEILMVYLTKKLPIINKGIREMLHTWQQIAKDKFVLR